MLFLFYGSIFLINLNVPPKSQALVIQDLALGLAHSRHSQYAEAIGRLLVHVLCG